METLALPAYKKQVQQPSVYPGLNAAKGVLIIMVVLTHALPPSRILYFLYLFHMPLFLSISGFLIRTAAFKDGLGTFLRKLLHRLGIPWLIASVLYLPFSLGERLLTDLTVTDVLYPFYHLWYVPAYFVGVVLCYAVTRFRMKVAILLPILAVVSLLWFVLFRENQQPVSEQPLYWIGDKRFYCYLFFFLLGFSLRNGLVQLKMPALMLIALSLVSASGLIAGTLFRFSFGVVPVLYLVFNTALILYVLQHLLHKQWLQVPLVLSFNKQSLGVYLFHPMIVMSIYLFLGDPTKLHTSKATGLAVGLATLVIIQAFIQIAGKSPVFGRYLLGNIAKRTA